MGKRVLVCVSDFRVFDSESEAAEALGVTPVAVSKALKEYRKVGDAELRWVERIYAVKTRAGRWSVAVLSGDNRRYVELCTGVTIKRGDVVQRRDLTESWHRGER